MHLGSIEGYTLLEGDEMLYNFEIPKKSIPVLVDGATLEDGTRMSLNGIKFIELTRIKPIREVKKIGFAMVKVIFDRVENAGNGLSRTPKSNRSFQNPSYHKTSSTSTALELSKESPRLLGG